MKWRSSPIAKKLHLSENFKRVDVYKNGFGDDGLALANFIMHPYTGKYFIKLVVDQESRNG